MRKPRKFYVVDAFSDRPLYGNPAVIVPIAEGLSDRAMRGLATELRMEAGFVLPPTQPEADLRMRFFLPGGEVDMSGHVTVAAYTALAAIGRLPDSARIRQESRGGVFPVEDGVDPPGGSPWVTLDLGRPVFGAALERRELAEALRVTEAALGGTAPRVVTCGNAVAVCGLGDPHTLHALSPDMTRLALFSRRRGVLGVAAFARPGLHPQSSLTARFFFPAVGPDEDVVSGAALAAICAFAVRERQLACVGETVFHTDQGHSLGRPNRAQVIVTTDGGQVADLRVRGRAVIVASGDLAPID